MNCCPAPTELESLLDGDFSAPAAAGIRDHVQSCGQCRALLDSLTDDPELGRWAPDSWSSDREVEIDANLARLLDSLHAVRPSELDTIVWGGATQSAGYSFLGPPRREGDLGDLDEYPVVAELGRGGMGIVFLAFDEALGREVALKVLRPELTGEAARERFVREARAAARVRHDHVVGIHAVARTAEGLPYCVLEYLRGPSLAARIRTEKRLAPREAAEIAAQVAGGLAAAHAAGLVHRDIKPANILSDPASNRVKIVDFGLVQFEAVSGELTQAGALAGTPWYMSPEQARGSKAIGAASDIYSLGVTLYESLTGEPPFRGEPHLVLQAVQHEEPKPPRELSDAIPRDLEVICLKCLAKEPHRRYESAVDLAHDLRRFLAGEPIAARPVPRWERWVRRARRHRVVTGLAASSLLLTLALFVGGGVYAFQLRAANARAERNFQRAFEAVDRMLSRVGAEELADVPEMTPVRRKLLADALEFLRSFLADRERSSDPAVLRGLALAHDRMGSIQATLGQPLAAEQEYRREIAIHATLAGRSPRQELDRRDLAGSHRALASVLSAQYRRDEAMAEYRLARECYQPLIQADPGARRGLAACLSEIAALQYEVQKFTESERSSHEAIALFESLPQSEPATVDELAKSRYRLALIYHETHRLDQAEASLLACRDLWQPLAADRRGARRYQSQLAECLNALSILYIFSGHAPKAEPPAQAALVLRQQLAKQFPNIAGAQEGLALANHTMALRYHQDARPREAIPFYQRSIEIREELERTHPEDDRHRQLLVGARQNLGHVYQWLGEDPRALALFETALSTLEKLRKAHPAEPSFPALRGTILVNVGTLLTKCGRAREALAKLDESVALTEAAIAAAPNAASPRGVLYNACGARAQAKEALGLYLDAAPDWERVIELSAPEKRDGFILALSLAFARAGQHKRALSTAQELASRHQGDAPVLYNLACLYALASKAARSDSSLTTQHRQALERTHADRALGLLEQIRATGYFHDRANQDILAKDADFDGLRERPEFVKFVHQLESSR
jgi:tetratricopeptide (TPR) repeat protein